MRSIGTVHAEPSDSVESPVYRVNFWQQPGPGYAWNLDAYVLTEARDITEVLLWVNEQADGRPFEVFIEMAEEPILTFEQPRTSGLIRVLGSNPNEGERFNIGEFKPA